MIRRVFVLLLIVAPVGIGCQAPTVHATSSLEEGETVSLERGAIADALRMLCPPRIDPLTQEPWSREELVIEIEYGLELSEWDIDQILKIAAKEGLSEPYRLDAREWMGPRSYSVRVYAQPEEDVNGQTCTLRWLTVSCPDWLDGRRTPLPEGDPTDWVMARGTWSLVGIWDRETVSCFRDGNEVWTFRKTPSVTYKTAMSLFVSWAQDEWIDESHESALDSELWQPQFKDGYLGTVAALQESGWVQIGVPEHWQRVWEFVLEVPTGPGMRLQYFLTRRETNWVLVHSRAWT